MKTIQLGKMEKEYMCSPAVGKADEGDALVERFPTVYIHLDSLPDLKPGQEVTLKGVITSFSDKKVRTKEDGKQEIETVRSCEIDVLELTPGENKGVGEPPAPNDEEEVSKGLKDAEEPDDEIENDDEEEK